MDNYYKQVGNTYDSGDLLRTKSRDEFVFVSSGQYLCVLNALFLVIFFNLLYNKMFVFDYVFRYLT